MSNIDEEAKNNFTIEMRIFENYEKVKHEIIKAIDFLEHSGTNIFKNQDHEFWYQLNPGSNLKGLVLPISGFLIIRNISHIGLRF